MQQFCLFPIANEDYLRRTFTLRYGCIQCTTHQPFGKVCRRNFSVQRMGEMRGKVCSKAIGISSINQDDLRLDFFFFHNVPFTGFSPSSQLRKTSCSVSVPCTITNVRFREYKLTKKKRSNKLFTFFFISDLYEVGCCENTQVTQTEQEKKTRPGKMHQKVFFKPSRGVTKHAIAYVFFARQR